MFDSGFRNMLVCLAADCADLSPAQQAVRFAASSDASITLTTLVDAAPERLQFLMPASVHAWHEAYVNDTKSRLSAAAQKVAELQSNGPEVQSQVLIGTDSLELVREVLRAKFDALFLALSFADDKPLALGPGDFKLLRNAPCPVWLAPKSQSVRRIAVAVAPITMVMPEDVANRAIAFNRYLTQYAIQVAAKCDAELHIIQAWQMLGESWITTRTGYDQYHIFVQQIARALQQEFQQLLREFESSPVKIVPHFLQGYPEDVIPRVLRAHDIDLLTIGAVARVGIWGHLMGSTAERVLSQIGCNALVLKPEDWETPVRLA